MRMMTIGAALALGLLSGTAFAAPQKTECLVGAKPGGGFDLTCRLAANSMQATGLLSAPMAVTYMEGGVGAVGYNHVVGSRPDDPGLIVAASSGSALLLAQGKFGSYDENAVRWVGAIGADYGVIAVAADSPIKDMKSLVEAYAKNPGDFPVAGGGAIGSQDWMKAALVAQAAKVDPKTMRYVALEGGGAVMTALAGGHVAIASGDAAEFAKQHAAGKLRILAVMAPERLPGEMAGVPTAKEQGFDIDWTIWRGFYVGPKVSDADYNWWVEQFSKLVATPEFAKERTAQGLYPINSVGADYEKRVKADVERFRALAKAAGL